MSTTVAERHKTVPSATSEAGSRRLLSVDALRGFDMLLISGGAAFLIHMEGLTGLTWVDWLARQMRHPAWHGFTFYDFIFPLFLFIAGVALAFSLSKWRAARRERRALYGKTFIRMLILIGLGILYKNAPVPVFEPSEIRVVSVLGRIGIATFLATFLYLNFSNRARLLWVCGILLAYYAALFLIPVPGYGAGNLTIEGNLAGWIDRHFLPGRLLQGNYDELGLLTQLPALCLTVFGTMAGDVLRSRISDYRKVGYLTAAGVVGISIGLIWDLHFPINKHLWSSSFIMLTGGMAFLAMALFYAVIDVLHFRKWAFFFQVIGLNSLTIYLAYRFVPFSTTSHLLFEGIYAPLPNDWHSVFQAVGAMLLVWLFLYFLYRKKLFLKI